MSWLVLAALVGCGSREDDLHGLWGNVEDGTARAMEFYHQTVPAGGQRDDYDLWFYPEGTTPVKVQWGTYWIEDGYLVTESYSPVGGPYSNRLVSLTRDAFEIETTEGGIRRYERTDALP